MRQLLGVVTIAMVWPGLSAAASAVEPQLFPPPGAESPCGFARVVQGFADVRPAPGPLTIGTSHFRVHYADAALAAYAQDVSDASELAYRVLVDTIGHLPPPSDGTQGGDARTDVYLRTPAQIGSGIYGRTVLETVTGSPYSNSSTSWVEIVDTLSLARRRIVAAHEYYHVIQVGYDRDESVSMLEMLSTWVEDRVYSYHLNLATLQLFFRWPWRGLFSQFYTNSPWAIYLAERHGDGILRDALAHGAEVPGPNPRQAFDEALLAATGKSFLDEFVEFGTFNYFTGSRDDGAHYSEGAIYREVTCEKRSHCYPFPFHASGPQAPAELGANYYFFDGDGHSDPLRLVIAPDYYATSMLTTVRFKGSTRLTSTTWFPSFTLPDTMTIDDWAECDSLLLVYQVNTGGSQNSFGLSASYAPPPVPAGDWVLVLDRDGCRAPFDGAGDEFTTREGEELPIAEALRANGAAVVVSDTIPAGLLGCVGVFVVGGFDGAAVTLSTEMLQSLSGFMDDGGDVYVEGSALGGLLSAGDAAQQAFWNRFEVGFTPGNAAGNVASWSTLAGPLIGAHSFGYDAGDPDSLVGVLTPGGAVALVEDDAGLTRATALVTGPSVRIMSTVLLGGSTGLGGSTRAGFLHDVMTLFGVKLASLSVVRASLSVDGRRVVIHGELENYDRETLALSRSDGDGVTPVSLSLERVGGTWRFAAHDQMSGETADYRLVDETGGRVLWEETARADTPALPLRVESVFPNPARDAVRVVIESAQDGRATLGIYDVAGRRVGEESAPLTRGTNVVFMRTPSVSGHYFVRVGTAWARAGARFSVIR